MFGGERRRIDAQLGQKQYQKDPGGQVSPVTPPSPGPPSGAGRALIYVQADSGRQAESYKRKRASEKQKLDSPTEPQVSTQTESSSRPRGPLLPASDVADPQVGDPSLGHATDRESTAHQQQSMFPLPSFDELVGRLREGDGT